MNRISVFDSQGNEQESVKVDFQIPKKEYSPQNFSCAVKTLRQNWRQGTVSCKGRSDVAFSKRKPWRQKGTGRARAGTLRSPLWRKGGITFGPQPRTQKLAMNRKQVRLALNNVFYRLLLEEDAGKKNICCLDFKEENKPCSRAAFNVLKNVGLEKRTIALFLPFQDEINYLSFRNIPNVRIFYFDQPNAFDLANNNCWIFLKKDLDLFKKMVSRWN